MHPAMMKVLAAEHVRDMLVSAAKAQRASEARHGRPARSGRPARRAWRGAAAGADLAMPQPGRGPQCPQSAMEH